MCIRDRDIAALIKSADITKGKRLSNKCAACHNFEKGKGTKVGPDLWGIVGRKKANVAGFSYSKAMASKGGDWSYQDLFHFIHKPHKFIPGTKMSFAGLAKVQEVADIIVFLHSLSDKPAPLPEDG